MRNKTYLLWISLVIPVAAIILTLGNIIYPAYKLKVFVEAKDLTPNKASNSNLSDWIASIMTESPGNYELVGRRADAEYVMQAALDQAEEITVNNKPELVLVLVDFKLNITELEPQTKQPELLPRLNISFRYNGPVAESTIDGAVKEVLRYALKSPWRKP